MCRYFPPDVDKCTNHLDGEGCNQDDAEKSRYIMVYHPEEAEYIADDGYDIWNYSAFLSS
jgi:hypothetical protein